MSDSEEPARVDPSSRAGVAGPARRRFSRRAVLGVSALGVVGGAAVFGSRPGGEPAERRPIERWRRPVLTRNRTGLYAAAGLVVTVDGSTSGLVAVDAVTGQPRWSYDALAPSVHLGPDAVYLDTVGEFVCVDLADGRERWQLQGTAVSAVGATTVATRTSPAGGTAYEVCGLRSADGSTIWAFPTDDPLARGADDSPDGIAHVLDGRQLTTVDAASGRVLWRLPNDSAFRGTMSSFSATMQRCGPALVLADDDLVPQALDARTGTELAVPLPETLDVADLCVVGSTLVCLDDAGGVSAWNADTAAVWTSPPPGAPDPALTRGSSVLAAGADVVLVVTVPDGPDRPGELQVRAHSVVDGSIRFTTRGPTAGELLDAAVVGDTLVLLSRGDLGNGLEDLVLAVGPVGG